jgi:hypothetical protein
MPGIGGSLLAFAPAAEFSAWHKARSGKESWPRVYPGMCLASYGPKESGRFQSMARSGQESIAQGLPWGITSTRICPEGATLGNFPSGRSPCRGSGEAFRQRLNQKIHSTGDP